MRVNKASLDYQLGRLNKVSKKKYQFSQTPGGWQLVEIEEPHGGERDISPHATSGEMYNMIDTILRYLENEKGESKLDRHKRFTEVFGSQQNFQTIDGAPLFVGPSPALENRALARGIGFTWRKEWVVQMGAGVLSRTTLAGWSYIPNEHEMQEE
jgi:hypothetical protein